MDIFKNRSKEIMIGVVLNSILYFSWYFGFLAVTLLFDYLLIVFRGHERLGKAIGAALMLFENILIYYYFEKSVACIFSYLLLSYTFLSASLNVVRVGSTVRNSVAKNK